MGANSINICQIVSMNAFSFIRDFLIGQLRQQWPEADVSKIVVEPPRDPAHGDMATNAAMVLAKPLGLNPRALAEQIAAMLKSQPDVTNVEVAGPGFINLRLQADFWRAQLTDILQAGVRYGDSDKGRGVKINVEYVSANPTGPLLASHARGAVIGDGMAALMQKLGYDVTREYWLNDAGAQVDVLARSVYHRYREALGDTMGDVPAGCYPGDYLKPVGAALAARDGQKWHNAPEEQWLPVFRTFASDAMMELIKSDLAGMHIHHDLIRSEQAVVDEGKVQAAFDELQAKGLIYYGTLEPPKGKTPDDWEPRDQHLFKATLFGDDVDRPLKKSDGSWTYFATDIAYQLDKWRRGFKILLHVFGADHAGYVKRLSAAVAALSDNQAEFDVKICQMVQLMENGKPVKISKRAGNLVLVSDVLERVGPDVIRLMMLTRKNDVAMDFDFVKVTEQSKDNPVFYIQYAHARICSVLRHAQEIFPDAELSDAALTKADLSLITEDDDLQMIKKLAEWPRIVEAAGDQHEPHRVVFYLIDVAAAFHSLWTKGKDADTLRFLHSDNQALTLARLALIRAAALVVASGLDVVGVKPVESM